MQPKHHKFKKYELLDDVSFTVSYWI